MFSKKQHIVRKTMIVSVSFILGILATVIAAATYDANIQNRAGSMLKSIKSNASTLPSSEKVAYYTLVHNNIQSLIQVLTGVDSNVMVELGTPAGLDDESVIDEITNTGSNTNTGTTNTGTTGTGVTNTGVTNTGTISTTCATGFLKFPNNPNYCYDTRNCSSWSGYSCMSTSGTPKCPTGYHIVTGTNYCTIGATVTTNTGTTSNIPKPVFNFTTASYSVPKDTVVRLNWYQMSDVTSCIASGDWSGNKSVAGGGNGGSEDVTIGSSKTFTLTCTGAGGSTAKTITVATQSTTVNPATPALSLKVNNSLGPIDTEVGEPLLGTYTSNVDVTNCSAGPGFSQYQPDTTLTPTSAKAGTINNALAHRTSSPSTSPQDFDYTLSCRGPDGLIWSNTVRVKVCLTGFQNIGGVCTAKVPVVPVCTAPQTLDTTTNTCVTPISSNTPSFTITNTVGNDSSTNGTTCLISEGSSSCSITIMYSTVNISSLKWALTAGGVTPTSNELNKVLATSSSPTGTVFGIGYGLQRISLQAIGGTSTFLVNREFTGECIGGTTWNTSESKCLVTVTNTIPIPSLTADKTIATTNETVTFNWASNNLNSDFFCRILINNITQSPNLQGASGTFPISNLAIGTNAINVECNYSGHVRVSSKVNVVVTVPTVVYMNLVVATGVPSCNEYIFDKFGTQKYTCSIGGACGLNGQPSSSTNPSANSTKAGACILKSEWDSANNSVNYTSEIIQMFAGNPLAHAYLPNGPTQELINAWKQEIMSRGLAGAKTYFPQAVTKYAEDEIKAKYNENSVAKFYNPNGPDQAAIDYWKALIISEGPTRVWSTTFPQAVLQYEKEHTPSITVDKTTATAGSTITFGWSANGGTQCYTSVNGNKTGDVIGIAGNIPVSSVPAGSYSATISCTYAGGIKTSSPVSVNVN